MPAKIIDGKAIAAKLRAEYHVRVDELKSRHSVTPGLAVVLVGDNQASRAYVRNKIKACQEAGIRSDLIELPAQTSEAELLERIEALNGNAAIHGILVQLPLPPHIRVSSVLEAISVEKDVDGFHLYNMGGLVTGNTVFSPCTPYGVQKILEHENIK
ncbi:MAG TPA: tetrahydrofolate dehydrogenase/cyclohydrolase catalytic domain-containing protein, partial [Povalibacter sp.]